jgi:glycosyltransferase involved in cell wall biosynthesis
VLISAFVRVASLCPNISLEIVGDGPEKSNLMHSVPGEFKSRIIFKGNVPFEQRAESFGKADVFVHPARHDGWGVVIQEAMAAGLSVISTRETGAAYDLVDEGQNGFLVRAGDANGLADRIAWMAKNRDQLSRLGMNAKRKASGFTPEWGAERFVQISRSILDAR